MNNKKLRVLLGWVSLILTALMSFVIVQGIILSCPSCSNTQLFLKYWFIWLPLALAWLASIALIVEK